MSDETEFEQSLDCDARFYSNNPDVTPRERALADRLESLLVDFRRTYRDPSPVTEGAAPT